MANTVKKVSSSNLIAQGIGWHGEWYSIKFVPEGSPVRFKPSPFHILIFNKVVPVLSRGGGVTLI